MEGGKNLVGKYKSAVVIVAISYQAPTEAPTNIIENVTNVTLPNVTETTATELPPAPPS